MVLLLPAIAVEDWIVDVKGAVSAQDLGDVAVDEGFASRDAVERAELVWRQVHTVCTGSVCMSSCRAVIGDPGLSRYSGFWMLPGALLLR